MYPLRVCGGGGAQNTRGVPGIQPILVLIRLDNGRVAPKNLCVDLIPPQCVGGCVGEGGKGKWEVGWIAAASDTIPGQYSAQ